MLPFAVYKLKLKTIFFFYCGVFFRLLRRPQQPAEEAAEARRIGRRSSRFAPQQKRLYTTRIQTGRGGRALQGAV